MILYMVVTVPVLLKSEMEWKMQYRYPSFFWTRVEVSPSSLRFYIITGTQWSCSPGSLWEIPDSNSEALRLFWSAVRISSYSPWGEVVATTDEREGIVYADIDLDYLETIRFVDFLNSYSTSSVFVPDPRYMRPRGRYLIPILKVKKHK